MLRTQLLRPLCTWRARGGIFASDFFFFLHTATYKAKFNGFT